MSRFYFIRHADAYDQNNVQLEDSSLSNAGKIQALQLAKRLKDNKFAAMYCSKIKRAKETSEIVNEDHGLKVIYDVRLNEVGEGEWPQPGVITKPQALTNFKKASKIILEFYTELVKKHEDEEVIIFTHGNWIRVLLTEIIDSCMPETFAHFVIHNTSLNIIDVREDGFAHIISVSDAAHTYLYGTEI